MGQIRAVAFDLWGTLIVDDNTAWDERRRSRSGRMLALLARLGHSAPPGEELRDAYLETWRRAGAVRATGLDVSSRQQVGFFLEAVDPTLAGRLSVEEWDLVANEFAEALVLRPPQAVPGAREALRACRAAGTRTALVSNTGQTPGRTLRRILRALGLADAIDVWVFSDEIRLSKPIPAIFRHVLGALGAKPGETLFVGDTPELDIIPARASGMWALQVGAKPGPPGPSADIRLPDLNGFSDALASIGLELSNSR